MPTQFELFEQMTITLDHLVDNAKKMKEEIRQKSSQDDEHAELESLQLKQHEILVQLGELNKLLESSPKGANEETLDQCKAKIRERLGHFQVINQDFFDSISQQERVIDAKPPKKRSAK